MPNRQTAADYSPADLLRVRQTCLFVFSQLPPHLMEDITVVGGLVPSLLIDLFYVLRNYGAGIRDVFTCLAPLLKGSKEAQRALEILASDFADANGDGATAVPVFLFGKPDDELQADVAGFARALLACFGMAPM